MFCEQGGAPSLHDPMMDTDGWEYISASQTIPSFAPVEDEEQEVIARNTILRLLQKLQVRCSGRRALTLFIVVGCFAGWVGGLSITAFSI